MKKLLEEIIGMDVEEAKELLEDNNIKFQEETKKKVSIKEKTGTIVKAEVDKDTKEVVLYESNRGILVMPMLLVGLMLLGLSVTYGTGIYESIKEQILEIGGIGAPELEAEEGWGKTRLVKVVKDANSSKKISHYVYCVRENKEKECESWKKTTTKNALIGETGHWYVSFRAVDVEGNIGREATKEVYVDNNSPEINSFKVIEKNEKSVKVKTEAKDKHSGIDKYMYSADGKTYIEGKEEYTYNNLEEDKEYRVYVKVIDKVGNESTVSILVKTDKKEEVVKEEKEETEEERLERERKEKEEKERKEREEYEKWDIPKINLDKIPSVFDYATVYELPSYYDFGNDTGEVVCKVDGVEAKDTGSIPVGRHTIICTATSSHGKQAQVRKVILVQAEEGEDEVKDGWIKLNLYYPEESYNWQWRYGLTDNDIDEEFEEQGWQDYTGPILIKIEDIPRIYIRYDMDGETYIIPPAGYILVDIEPEVNPVACGESTNVAIRYDDNAVTKEYRINGGRWQNYTGPFEVYGNTQIDARATKNEDVYNNEGEFEYTQLVTGRDVVTIRETGCTNPSTPDEDEEKDVVISLYGVPSTVYLGESYSLPSYYTYGTHGQGTYTCVDQEGNNVTNTKYLAEGRYTVTCRIEAGDGTRKGPVSKEFEVIRREHGPEIAIEDIPEIIALGDSFRLPTNYTYGSHGVGTVLCVTDGGETVTNTSSLEVGTHEITCTITAADGATATDSARVTVRVGFEPRIDLQGLGSQIEIGSFVHIPSNYNYGRPSYGTVTCTIDGVAMDNTRSLGLGSHYVHCEIVNGAGLRATTSKTIEVIPRSAPEDDGERNGLAGPIITGTPSVITTNPVTITITPQEAASRIMYKINTGGWQIYNGAFPVTQNCTITAYYVRASDGKQSQTSSYRVTNIRVPYYPSVVVTTTPQTLTGNERSVIAEITGIDADHVYYSFTGLAYDYHPYTGPLTITQSCTVYAKATNSYGEAYDQLQITIADPPAPLEVLEVEVIANPDGTQEYQINETEITIMYDSRATTKQYRIGSNGPLQDYTGPFTVNQNTTVYGYATCTGGAGSDSLAIDYLILGISDPIISVDIESPTRAHSVEVTIAWDQHATVKKYKIVYEDGTDTGWLDYTRPFEVDDNCEIYAYQENDLGDRGEAGPYAIENIIPIPQYTSVDLGDYYLIRLNYPSTSQEEAREYKWKTDGVWKEYNYHGILIIKQEAAERYDLTVDGVEIEDTNGNRIRIDMEHVYVLDVPFSELAENLFMRWDNTRPQAPTINVNTEEAATEVEVSISYPRVLIEKYYKIIDVDGNDSGWLEYEGPFTITRNNTTIYAKGVNRIELSSDTVNRTLTNIDEEAPEIEIDGDLETPTRQLNLTVTAEDDKMLYMVKWAKGRKTVDYFNEEEEGNGTTIRNGSTVAINENGIYTFYAVDQAGNETIKEVEVTNIDLEAPNLTITVLTSGITTSANVEINYGDAVTKQYKIGYETNWSTYTNRLLISSYDYYEHKNDDGSLTVYAKGVDSAGNTIEIEEKIRCLDLDMPEEPEIVLSMNFPKLTSEGFTTNNSVAVTFDDRSDIVNEISLDNGATWHTYTGREAITNQTKVMARSKKVQSGLTASSSVTVLDKNNTLTDAAFDNDNTSKQTLTSGQIATFDVDNDGAVKKITIKNNGTSANSIRIYGTDGSLNKTISIASASQLVTLPSGTTKVEIVAGGNGIEITEIKLNGLVAEIEGDSILSIMQNNSDLSEGYYTFKINGKSEKYSVHLIEETNHTISSSKTYGDSADIGTANTYAENMVIVKVNGDLTINSSATVGPVSSTYGGPKGFMLYVTGKLTNNGIIDNSHGAYAKGEDVYLWKNANGTYEYVPAVGGAGAAAFNSSGPGHAGNSGTGRQTGGGSTGISDSYYTGKVGAGGTGTSYSGGAGGASHRRDSSVTDGSNEGGAGGYCYNGECSAKYRGAGNPQNGTGGLLIIYANGYINNGTIQAKGAVPNETGGSSGGGSINIFTNQPTGIDQLGIITQARYDKILGSTNYAGGNYQTKAGDGTVNIGEIRNGTYCDLKDCIDQDKEAYIESVTKTGDSIINILKDNPNMSAGYYTFKISGKNEKYSVHLIDETSHTISSSKTYGDSNDVSDGTNYAQNMVIVRVKGDLTINGSSTVISPYYTDYGGPKGFMLYVTGKLTNNGIIDNSHGAYAKGENVYLLKNSDGTYEYVPAVGGAGAAAFNSTGSGHDGNPGTGRQTGGGATGISDSYYTGKVGAGGTGTSYSGGPGGASHRRDSSVTDGSNEGGAGGYCYNGECSSKYRAAGNPAGGTGGLLIICADTYQNNGTVRANGAIAAQTGGSSGGGSINIFYNTKLSDGTVSATGGKASGTNGGDGTVTYTSMVEHVITFNTNGGTLASSTRNVPDGHTIGTLPVPSKTSSDAFVGWYTSNSYTTRITPSYKPTGNVTLYAKYVTASGLKSINSIPSSQYSSYIGKSVKYNGDSNWSIMYIGSDLSTDGVHMFLVSKTSRWSGKPTANGNYNNTVLKQPAGANLSSWSNSYYSSNNNSNGASKTWSMLTASNYASYCESDICDYAIGGPTVDLFFKGYNLKQGTSINYTSGMNSTGYNYQLASGLSNVFNFNGSNTWLAGPGSYGSGWVMILSGTSSTWCWADKDGNANFRPVVAIKNNARIYSDGTDYIIVDGNYAVSSNSLTASNQVIASQELRIVENVITANTLGDTISPSIKTPTVNVEKTEESRIITIDKEETLKTEYSLDLGENWIEYQGQFEIEENGIILVRTVDGDGKILKTSTYTVTSLPKKEEKVEEEESLEESTEVLPSEEIPKEEIVDKSENEEEKPEEGDTNE